MADWRKLCIAIVLADGVIDDAKVKVLKKELWTDGKIDMEEVNFLIELRNQAQAKKQQMSPAFEKLVFEAIEQSTSFSEEAKAQQRLPETVWRAIKERKGQPEFREQLLAAYGRRCAVTDCDAEPALEAAHIRGYAETGSQHVTNGLLLRADIHTLFDLDLVRIDPETLRVDLDQELRGTCYGELQGRQLRMPERPAARPSREALRERWGRAR